MKYFGKETVSAAFFAACLLGSARAQEAPAADNGAVVQLQESVVTAQHNPVSTPSPTVNVTIDESQIDQTVVADPEDVLKYAPNLFVRKRFIGDRNGVLSIRGASPFQNARTLVFVDGVNLTNLLENRWNGAPKWQIVAPEEIVNVDVEYGPYSPKYSGNAMNGVVNFQTRQPYKQEFTLSSSLYVQNFDSYGTDNTYIGNREFASYGDRFGKLSIYGFYQRLENEGHPMSFVTKLNPAAAAGQAPVTGAFRDLDPGYQDRLILGATSITEVNQDLYKLKLAYDISDDLRLQVTVGLWDTVEDDSGPENYLRDAGGNPVWNGAFAYGGVAFNTTSADWQIVDRTRQDLLIGTTLEGTVADDLDFQAVFTFYDILKDQQLTSNQNPADPAYNGTGRVQEFGDTYWWSGDLRLGKTNVLSVDGLRCYGGYGYNYAEYNIKENNSSNYAAGVKDGALRNDDGGDTSTHAVYGQVDWDFVEHWTATLGGRAEQWDARNGHDNAFYHPDRDDQNFSPKASLAYRPDDKWELRASIAKAVRYPIVTELFVGDPNVRNTVVNNPSLKPEESISKTLMAERKLTDGSLYFALFRNDETDTIYNDRATLANGSTLTTFVNIDEVVTQGVEFGWQQRGVLLDKLDLNFNISYNDTEIKKYRVNPAVEGNELPRVPDWRINLLAGYHFTDHWQGSVGGRFANSSYDDLANSEDNSQTYEGMSQFLVWDLKTTYKFDNGLELSAGIDNVFNEEYWMHHPHPQRTFQMTATWKF